MNLEDPIVENNPKKNSWTIVLLTFFYSLLVCIHLAGRSMYKGGQIFIVSVIVGTCLYLIWGFFTRNPMARIIAIGLHVYLLFSTIVSGIIFMQPQVFAQLNSMVSMKDPSSVRGILIILVIFLSLLNIAAILYLFKNKDYFVQPDFLSKDSEDSEE